MDTKERRRPANARSGGTATAGGRPRRRKSPDVVYTQPKVFQRNRFLLHLATVAAVVLALTLGMSIFFKVENVAVAGTQKYTPWDIREASGIQEGENLLTLNEAMVAGKIKTQLPYVDTVRLGIKLPDTVNIEITELDVVYAIQALDASWWLMTSTGRLVEVTTNVQADSYTKILGVQIEEPKAGAQAAAAQPVPETEEPTDAAETEPQEGESATTEAPTAPPILPVTVLASEQLDMAITILQYLEDNSVLGGVDYVDVTDLYDLQLRYEDRYQVLLGDGTQMGVKIKGMKQAIDQMTDYQRGDLDVSFTTFPDQVVYTPFLDE